MRLLGKKQINLIAVCISCLFLIANCQFTLAQSVGINATGAAPVASSMLDVSSANKGVLFPRVSLTSTTDVITIPTPATSLLVFNTNAAMTGGSIGYYYWDGAKWVTLGGGTPSGVISLWSGIITSIPAGWALCDGTNGTPNLNDYFIKGTTVQANMNTTGGANAVTLTAANIPLLTTSNPTITENLYSGILLWQPGFGGFWAGSGGPAAGVTSTFQHTHTVGNASPAAINTQPQYYVLAYIMKL